MVWINQLTEKKTPPFSDVDSIYTEVADIVTHDTSHEGKEDPFIGASDNEIESTETDNAVKGEDTATKIDIESFEQNLTESETTKLDVGALEQNSTELEKKTAQINDGITGKSLSEALIFASINPQYDNRWLWNYSGLW